MVNRIRILSRGCFIVLQPDFSLFWNAWTRNHWPHSKQIQNLAEKTKTRRDLPRRWRRPHTRALRKGICNRKKQINSITRHNFSNIHETKRSALRILFLGSIPVSTIYMRFAETINWKATYFISKWTSYNNNEMLLFMMRVAVTMLITSAHPWETSKGTAHL